MKEINYSYTQNKDIVEKGITLSEMYSITKGKRILFTLLCLFIITNSSYAMITTAKVSLLHVVYVVFGIAILGYVWFLPDYIVKRKLKTVEEKEISVLVKPGEIIISENGEEKTKITAKDYRGYKKGEDMFVVYSATAYAPLPTENLGEEQKAEIEEVLKYFHNPDYFKSAEEKADDNQPEFPPFVPPEDFTPNQEETTQPIENEEA